MAKHIFIALVLIVSLFTGCAESLFGGSKAMEPAHYTNRPHFQGTPRRAIPVVVDKNFSVNDKKSIDDAINTWNYVLNGHIVMKVEGWEFDMEIDVLQNIISRRGLIIMKIDHDNPVVNDDPKQPTLARANDIGGNKVWMVRDRFESEDVYPIMLHELGHIFGAEHEEDKPENIGFLMYPHYIRGKYNCVDERAMKRVAQFQMIMYDQLNFCY